MRVVGEMRGKRSRGAQTILTLCFQLFDRAKIRAWETNLTRERGGGGGPALLLFLRWSQFLQAQKERFLTLVNQSPGPILILVWNNKENA